MNDMTEKIAQRMYEAAYAHDWATIDKNVKAGWIREAEALLSLETKTHRIAVIKKEGELPINSDVPDNYNDLACGAEDDSDNISKAFYVLGQDDMLKAGYVQEEKK